MSDRRDFRIATWCFSIAVLVAGTAAAGVFMRGSGASAASVSIRDEAYLYATDGVYAFNALRVVAEGVGWDLVTLFLVVPLLLGALPFLARGSDRARILVMGLLAYLFYQYLMYAVFWAFGPLFPLYVVIYPASLLVLLWIGSTLDIKLLPARFDQRFPRRGLAILAGVMGALLVAMWSQRIGQALQGDIQGVLFGGTTLAVQALDLGLIVPLAFVGAALVWRRRPVGYLLACIFAVKGATMGAAICAMLLSAWRLEGTLEVVPFGIFLTAASLSTLFLVQGLRSLGKAADVVDMAA